MDRAPIAHLGGGKFALSMTIPEARAGDFPPSAAHKDVVAVFCGALCPDGITDHQCHALLLVRTYSRACVAAAFPELLEVVRTYHL